MKKKRFEIFLLTFKVNGIKNIEEEITLDFYKSSFSAFKRDGYKVKAVYGENGVGKSAIVTGIKIFRDLMISKNYIVDRTNIEMLEHLINKKTNTAFFESEYYVSLNNDSRIYKFGLELKYSNNSFSITREYCYYKTIKGKYKVLYEVVNGELSNNTNNSFDKYVKDVSKNLLKDSSFLSVVFTNDFDEKYSEELKKYEMAVLCHVYTYAYLDEKDTHNNYVITRIVNNLNELNNTINNSVFVTGLEYIKCGKEIIIDKSVINNFEKEIDNVTKFIQIFKPELKRIEVDKKENKESYVCELIFVYNDYRINSEFESTGIKKLVELYTAFKKIDDGYVVFIDELDANIHDYYLCKLLEFVAEYSDGQLCFTTHNLGPMKVLKRYKKSIDFLSRGFEITPWIKNGNYDVSSLYSKGLIDKSPFNLESFDFLEVFGEK